MVRLTDTSRARAEILTESDGRAPAAPVALHHDLVDGVRILAKEIGYRAPIFSQTRGMSGCGSGMRGWSAPCMEHELAADQTERDTNRCEQ